ERTLVNHCYNRTRCLYAGTILDHPVMLLEENDILSRVAGLDCGGISKPHSSLALDIELAPVSVAERRLLPCTAATAERGQQQEREQRTFCGSACGQAKPEGGGC